MTVQYSYSPIVKGKANDLKALSRLAPTVRGVVKPLVELVPVSAGESTDDHLLKFADYVVKYQSVGRLFVDFYGFLPGEKISTGLDATIAGFRLLRKKGRLVTPTYGLGRDPTLWPLLKKEVASNERGFCFRIDFDDLDDQSEESWQEIIERSAEMELDVGRTDLLIDLRYVGNRTVNELKERVLDFLSFMPSGKAYRSIIICGSSALKHVGEVPKDRVGDVLRKELRLWIELRLDIPESTTLVFGDYGVIHPEFSDMGPNKNANAKIRYTAGGRIYVHRGHKLFDPSDFAQYHALAERVRSSAQYRGANYSFGDRFIDECADFNSGPGNLGSWVLADMNHHVQYSANQLQKLVAQVTPNLSENQIGQLVDAI